MIKDLWQLKLSVHFAHEHLLTQVENHLSKDSGIFCGFSAWTVSSLSSPSSK